MKRLSGLLLCILLVFPNLPGQEKKAVTLSGYVSVMETVQKSMFDTIRGDFQNQNLIHNRLNFKAYAGAHLSFGLELRNRLFTGSVVSSNTDYATMIGIDQGLFDLSWNIIDQKTYFLNTTIDRYWADYNIGKFQARIGRQRINWGQTLVWNPNDIFNPYSVFEVDYVERPGCDAIRLQYFPSAASAVEFAVKGDASDNITLAGLYRLNHWGYDIQFLAGYAESQDLVLGTGWSGALGSISFRGEASWFSPVGKYHEGKGRGLFTIGFDKVFKNSSMFQVQVMYCNDPIKPDGFSSFYMGTLSAKDLAFSEFSAFAMGTYAITPLMNLSLSAMWLPDLRGYFISPAFDYSVTTNLDLSLIWQYFTSMMGNDKATNNLGFLRLKYSF